MRFVKPNDASIKTKLLGLMGLSVAVLLLVSVLFYRGMLATEKFNLETIVDQFKI